MTTLEKIRAEIFGKSVLMPHDRNFYIKVATVTMDVETNKVKVEDSDVLEIIAKYAILEKIKKEIADNHDYYFFAENNKDIALGLEFALDIIDEHQKAVSK